MRNNYTYPALQVRSSSIIAYTAYALPSNHKPNAISLQKAAKTRELSRLANLNGAQTYSGNITDHSRKRIARAVSLLVQSSPWQTVQHPVKKTDMRFRLGFLTLTIPIADPVKSKWAYQALLKPFLQQMKRKCGLTSYVWKAELQERGQLHYHITTNCFMEFWFVRDAWANLLRKHDLIGVDHSAKHNSEIPCSEVKRVYKIKNVESYLVKYISKSDGEGRSVFGKAWGCSENLKGVSYFTDILCSANEAMLSAAVDAKQAVCKVLKRCTLWLFNGGSPLSVLTNIQRMTYKQYIAGIATTVP